MGSSSSISLDSSEVDEICRETGFSHSQLKRLFNRFNSLDKENLGFLRKEDLSSIPELYNPVRDRIIDVLITDHGQNGHLNFRQFANVLAVFRRKTGHSTGPNTIENKLRFIFDMYDRDKDNFINQNELLSILQMIVGDNLPEDQLNAIADRTIIELGLPVTEGISYEKFCDCLKKIDIDEKMSMKFLS
ncbi:calcineurin B homologous 1 [Brachionus plicatilis]|uniref:Calcineurin B homologous 1 n=1 Tax=Brachionus plicatilis TaxID=10195 RepID=A0A3M7QR88_BRAPC|nr:calcineurin B homologous 1 [Brachionus plicatilis]